MTKLNPFILVVVDNQLNPDKYTPKQLEDNADEAYKAANDVASHAAAANDVASHAAAANDAYDAAAYAYAAAAYAYTYAYDAAAYAYAAATYWLAAYFTKTNENKQDYIDELENPND